MIWLSAFLILWPARSAESAESTIPAIPAFAAVSTVSAGPAAWDHYLVTATPAADTVPGRRLPEHVVAAPPNAVRVVAVPIPAELRGLATRFTFVRQSAFVVLGRLAGELAPLDSVVVLSVSVPAVARAGPSLVGLLRFECAPAGCEPADVPLVLAIDAVPELQALPLRPLLAGAPGARVAAEFEVGNPGNSPLLVALTADAPPGWDARPWPETLHLQPGATGLVRVVARVPASSGSGDYRVILLASAAGAAADAAAQVRIDDRTARDRAAGAGSVATSMGVVLEETGAMVPVLGAAVQGTAGTDLLLDGRGWYAQQRPDGVAVRPLSRLGYSRGIGWLTLSSPDWRAAAGLTDVQDPGLAAGTIHGVGTSFHGGLGGGAISFMAGVPVDGNGRLAFGSFRRPAGPLTAGLLLAHMEERTPFPRRAVTAAALAELPWTDGFASLQIGHRDTDNGSGAAWLTRIRHDAGTWGGQASASRTPGGSRGFARAAEEWSASGYSRVAASVQLAGGFSLTGDRRATDDFSSRTLYLSPTLDLQRWGTAQLHVREGAWAWNGAFGSLRNVDREFRGLWTGRAGEVRITSGVGVGHTRRETALGGVAVDFSGLRTDLRLGVGGGFTRALWSLDATWGGAEPGTGWPSRYAFVRASLDQISLVPGRAQGRLDFTWQSAGTTGRDGVGFIAGVDWQVGSSYRVSFDAERRVPLLVTGRAASPWAAALRVERRWRVPQLDRGTDGLVFSDVNGNGRRDRGEPGVPGVVVVVDGRQVTTDRHGRFRVGQRRIGQARVDPRSLPAGWVAAPAGTSADVASLVLAVMPTRPVDVQLRVGPGAMQPDQIQLADAIVILTDSLGRQWTGTPDAGGFLRFDSLRPGMYEVGVSLTRLSEPLLPPSPLPRVEISGGAEPVRIDLLLSPRPIRMDSPSGIRQIIPSRQSPGPPDGKDGRGDEGSTAPPGAQAGSQRPEASP